jgi:hypothetical protein
MDEYYRANSPSVISEAMDQEFVIINLESGCYYSLNVSASLVWTQIIKQSSRQQIIDNFGSIYSLDTTTAEENVTSLIATLLAENLIVIDDTAGNSDTNPDLPEPPSAVPTWQIPLVEKFSDMQDMLLLDTIHEVSEAGWPHKK